MITTRCQESSPDTTARVADELRELRAELRQVTELREAVQELLAELRGRVKSHYSVAEVAEAVDRSPYTIRQWVSSGILRAVRPEGGGPRGKLLIPREELQRLVRGGRGSNLPDAVCG